MLAIYLAAGVAIVGVLGAVDGERGLRGGSAAWVICLVPLFFNPLSRRVAAGAPGPRIGGRWGLLQANAMLFRFAWALGGGAVVYARIGPRLGVGFWIALIVFYEVMLALTVAGLINRHPPGAPTGPPGYDGDRATHAPG
jgi:hypothetical protein